MLSRFPDAEYAINIIVLSMSFCLQCFIYSHFLWAMILQFSTLSVRVIALAWLLAVVGNMYFVVLILIFVPRALILAYLDPKSARRSFLRNTLWCSCYCLISAIWDKDDRFPVSSRRAYLCLNVLDTIECFVFICFAGFISKVRLALTTPHTKTTCRCY
jgi:hypothetical protein